MRILVVRGGHSAHNTDRAYYFAEALQSLGIDMRLVEHQNLVYGGVGSDLKRGLNVIGRRKRGWAYDRFRSEKKANDYLIGQCESFKPHLVVVFKGLFVDASTISQIRARVPGVRVVNYFSDNLLLAQTALMAASEYDHVYLMDTALIAKLEKLGLRNLSFLPPAMAPHHHGCPTDIGESDRELLSADVAMVGSIYPYRAWMLETLRGTDLRVWGGFWGFASRGDLEGLFAWERHQGRSVFGSEMAKVFALSKINVNTSQPVESISASNTRAHHISAAGGFQLHEAVGDLRRQYCEETEIITFKDSQELRVLVDHYLNHPEDRARIAEKARIRAHAEHTWEKRAMSVREDFEAGFPPVSPASNPTYLGS